VSPDRERFFPKLKENDSLSVQLQTVRLNGVCMNNVMENLIKIFLKLSEEAGQLCKDNILKIKMENISMAERPSVLYEQESLKQHDETSSAPLKNDSVKIYNRQE
jgi:hypothetical protein